MLHPSLTSSFLRTISTFTYICLSLTSPPIPTQSYSTLHSFSVPSRTALSRPTLSLLHGPLVSSFYQACSGRLWVRLLYKAVPQPAPHASTGQDREINLRVRARLFLCRIISFFILHIFGKDFARQYLVLFYFHFK